MSFELKRCPLCEKGKFDPAYLVKDRHYGIPGMHSIVRCAGCSLVFLNPMHSDEELAALYPAHYYAYQDRFSRKPWKDLLKRLLGMRIGTRDPVFQNPGAMLDLGCGSGWFMCDMRDQGWDTHGVEINRVAAELGRKTASLNIFPGDLVQANYPPSFFDYVRSNHSFEHICRPSETLEEIHRILRPGGKVLIGVPNVAGLSARVFGEYWWYLGAPVHPFTYSVETLSGILSKHNFCIQKVTYNSDYSGILGSLQIWLNRRNGRKSTEGRAINNLILRILCQWAAKCLDFLELGDAIEIIAVKTPKQFEALDLKDENCRSVTRQYATATIEKASA
jgi:SAM-dependent methyltransferase